MQLNKDNFLRWDGAFTITEIINIIFAAANDVQINTLTTSNGLSIYGLTAIRPISVSGGEMQINGGAWTTVPSTIQNGDTVRLRTTSSLNYYTTKTVNLVIGSNSGSFSVRTKIAPAVPLTISFGEGNLPLVDSDVLIFRNGVQLPTMTSTETRNYSFVAGDVIKVRAIAPPGSIWPADAYRQFKIAQNGSLIVDEVSDDTADVNEFDINLVEGNLYIATIITSATPISPVGGPYFLNILSRFNGATSTFYAQLTDGDGNPATLGTILNFNYDILIYHPGLGTYDSSAGVASLYSGTSEVDIYEYFNADSVVQYSYLGNPYPATVDGHDILV